MTDPAAKWNATARKVYDSPDHAWSRHIGITRAIWECRFCKEEKPVLEIDTSDGEYLSLICCGDCFSSMLEARQ